jgi:hypothetical protein
MNVAGLQDVAGWEILLLRGASNTVRGGDAEVATLILVEQPAEDRRRVEIRPGVFSAPSPIRCDKQALASLVVMKRPFCEAFVVRCSRDAAYQHMKSTLPSMPTKAQVLMFPIMP